MKLVWLVLLSPQILVLVSIRVNIRFILLRRTRRMSLPPSLGRWVRTLRVYVVRPRKVLGHRLVGIWVISTLVRLNSLRPRWSGRIVRFTILTRLTPLPPTRRSPVRGRQIFSGRLGAATPPCRIRLSRHSLLCIWVTGATAPRGLLLALVKTKSVLLAQLCYVARTPLVSLIRCLLLV